MNFINNWAVIIPMANEEKEFDVFISELKKIVDQLKSGKVYFVVDNVSKDATLKMCQNLSDSDLRFETVWAPENKNVVDAYMRGYREAYNNKHDFIIEMDAGMSHDPKSIHLFLQALYAGKECAFGCRFMPHGSMGDSVFFRKFLSKIGTVLCTILLGTKLKDMTSGFQGFQAKVVGELLHYQLRSKAHFYQSEVRYLLRNKNFMEVPIHYQAPSPRVSNHAIFNSVWVLSYYFFQRLFSKPAAL